MSRKFSPFVRTGSVGADAVHEQFPKRAVFQGGDEKSESSFRCV